MARSALIIEDVLYDIEKLYVIEFHSELFLKLAAHRVGGEFAELNAAAKGAVKMLSLDRVVAGLHENVPVLGRQSDSNIPD